MRSTTALLIVVLALIFASAEARPPRPQGLPVTTHEVVLEKTGTGYKWQLATATISAIGEHQVMVRVRAVSLNHNELDMLQPDPSRDHTGQIVGSDAAGDVVAVGKDVRGIHIGDRVTSLYFRNWTDGPFAREIAGGEHGWSSDGVFADYILLDDTAVAPIPAGLDYEEASTLPTAGLTAWTAVTETRSLRPGDVVLLQGTGGVSIFALQFAVAMGAHVIVTSSSDGKLQRAITLGATDTINYRTTPNWAEPVHALTHGHGADLVVDVGGKDTLTQSVACLADAGALSIVGGLSGYDGVVPAFGLITKRIEARGILVGSRADYVKMSAFIAAHHLHPVVDRVFTFAQYPDALAYLKSGGFLARSSFDGSESGELSLRDVQGAYQAADTFSYDNDVHQLRMTVGMIDKRVQSIADALTGIVDGAVILVGGFGAVGQPNALIEGLIEQGASNLTVVANNAGASERGLAKLLAAGRVRKVVCSFPRGGGGAAVFEDLYRAGRIELEVVPQGTLAERLRAAGAGIPAFYTPSGFGTIMAEGKETRDFGGRSYLLEHALHGDVALVEAWQADRWGNLTYRATARNFNPVMATAARCTIAQAIHIVELGDLSPEAIVTPGIFVDRVVQSAAVAG